MASHWTSLCLDHTGVVLNRGAAKPISALGVPPISELDWYLLLNCTNGCRQIVKKSTKGSSNQTRLRNTPSVFFDKRSESSIWPFFVKRISRKFFLFVRKCRFNSAKKRMRKKVSI